MYIVEFIRFEDDASERNLNEFELAREVIKRAVKRKRDFLSTNIFER